MVTCSKGSIGALLASSFCERTNSCANQVVTLKNVVLGDCAMEKLVMCCMNRIFIYSCAKVANEQFEFEAILTVEDNLNEEDEDKYKTVYLQHKSNLDCDQSRSTPYYPHV